MNDNMEFRKTKREEAEEILQLYQSLIGTEYCVWTENYPTEREVEFDLSRDALFCLREKPSGRLMGTISIDDDPEVEALSCWSEDLTPGGRTVQTGSGSRISESRYCQDPVAGSYGGIEITGL